MAKKPKPGKCVHCLSDPVERNWDHVFPASWYPDSTPQGLYKWQMPSCIPCNTAFGKMEEDFLRRIALCLDPDDPVTKSIVEKAMRGMKPDDAKSSRDAAIRTAVGRRILSQAIEGDEIPNTGIYPGMGEKWNRPRAEQTAIMIPAQSFRKITEKIVRGVFFIEDNKFIEPPYVISFYALDASVGNSIRATIDRFGTVYAREPGIVVRRAVTPDDNISSFFEIEFWKHFKTYASVMPAERDELEQAS